MRDSGDRIFHAAGDETFEAVKMLRAANPAQYQPAPGANYPNTEFGNNMKQIAQLLKANLGVEAAFTDVSGWDTHQNQGSVNGQLANRLSDFSASIAAFWRDMGDDAGNVTLVTMSEFGRTARENGTGGTDHGHANAMFVLGGNVKGGKVYGKWPGLENEQLNEGRDLALTTDFRQVLGEVVTQTLGAENLDLVFPGARLNRGFFEAGVVPLAFCDKPLETSDHLNRSMTSSVTTDSATAVTRENLELHIAAAQRRVKNPVEGIFGPDSITWRINRESALFLAAGRAACCNSRIHGLQRHSISIPRSSISRSHVFTEHSASSSP